MKNWTKEDEELLKGFELDFKNLEIDAQLETLVNQFPLLKRKLEEIKRNLDNEDND